MLNNEFKKSATEKLKSMDSHEFKKAFKAIGSELQTNEEWFCQLPTEEKAEFLSDVNVNEDFCGFCETKFRDCKPKECKYKNGCAESWKKWLKQPHTPIS